MPKTATGRFRFAFLLMLAVLAIFVIANWAGAGAFEPVRLGGFAL